MGWFKYTIKMQQLIKLYMLMYFELNRIFALFNILNSHGEFNIFA